MYPLFSAICLLPLAVALQFTMQGLMVCKKQTPGFTSNLN